MKRAGARPAFAFHPKLVDCLREGYDRRQLARDVGAGLTVGVVALPLAMAFAIASGVTPQAGIFTAIVAGFLISAFGGSRVQIGGPTGAYIVIVYGIVAQYGVANLIVATIMAGALLIAMGVARLGALIRFIPVSIVIGFTNGIAVLIVLSQVKDFLGLSIDLPDEFFTRLRALALEVRHASLPTVALAGTSLALLWLWPKRARVPGPIAVIVLASAAVAVLGLDVATIGTRFGGIPQGLPAFAPPDVTLATLRALVAPAITIALLGAIESLLSARVADTMIGDRHDPNQELVAQGIANVVAPLFGGLPATGAIARTATNVRTGGRTPIAGIVHALTLLVIVLVAAPLAKYVPLAALAAVLVVVAINMADWRAFRELARFSIPYRAVLVATFVVTVVFDLTLAVQIGLVLASLFFIYRISDLTQLERLSPDGLPPGIAAYKVFGALFFGSVGKLEPLLDRTQTPEAILILEMHQVISLDNTALDTLDALHTSLAQRGGRLILCGLNRHPVEQIARSPLGAALADDIVPHLAAALIRAQQLAGAARSA